MDTMRHLASAAAPDHPGSHGDAAGSKISVARLFGDKRLVTGLCCKVQLYLVGCRISNWFASMDERSCSFRDARAALISTNHCLPALRRSHKRMCFSQL